MAKKGMKVATSDSKVDTPLPSSTPKTSVTERKAPRKKVVESSDEEIKEKVNEKPKKTNKRDTNKKEDAMSIMEVSEASDSSETHETYETHETSNLQEQKKTKKKNGPGAIPRSMAKRVQTALKENESISSNVSIDKIQEILATYRLMTIDDVAKGLVVSEPNFLTYKRKAREEREYYNPKTGEPIFKPRHYVLCVEVKASTKDRFAEIPLDQKDIDDLDQKKQAKEASKGQQIWDYE